jgi:hypothetical protein
MSQVGSVWLVVLSALLAANLPFVTQHLLGVIKIGHPKSLALRLLELIAMYFAVGGVALWLEQRAGQIAPQNWEFYAITAALFITLAFPGFVYRYLLRHSSS